MTIFVLIFLVWSKSGPQFIDGYFPDAFNCEVAEGGTATMIQKDKTVTGWSIVSDCVPTAQARKT
jgi:hypothetical protein